MSACHHSINTSIYEIVTEPSSKHFRNGSWYSGLDLSKDGHQAVRRASFEK
jgi:hypothetical protein